MLTLENSVLATTSDLNAIFSSTLNLNECYNHATGVGRALRIPLGFLKDFKKSFHARDTEFRYPNLICPLIVIVCLIIHVIGMKFLKNTKVILSENNYIIREKNFN